MSPAGANGWPAGGPASAAPRSAGSEVGEEGGHRSRGGAQGAGRGWLARSPVNSGTLGFKAFVDLSKLSKLLA